jgi:hypothetical protein
MKCSIHLSYGRTSRIIADFRGRLIAHLAASSRFSRAINRLAERRLLFFSPFLMFVSPLDLFPQATQQGDGWTLVKTIATTRKPNPITL